MQQLLQRIRHLFRPGPSCQEVNRFLVDYLEGVLDPRTAARFKQHLERCPKCKPFFEQYLMTLELVKEEGQVEPPPELVEHTLAFLREHLPRSS